MGRAYTIIDVFCEYFSSPGAVELAESAGRVFGRLVESLGDTEVCTPGACYSMEAFFYGEPIIMLFRGRERAVMITYRLETEGQLKLYTFCVYVLSHLRAER